jgi:NAD(P)-dependent dehydrogenase (short-subunit alcohol dehydrogenase family)
VTEWVKNTFGLAERACVVTGGASGIGRGIALLLGQEGAKVAVLDRDEAGAQETVGLIVAAGGEGLAVTCDVSDQVNVELACAKVRERFGDAHVLINNAGFIRKGAIETLPLEDWNGLLSVNLTGYFLCAQTFGRGMLANGDGVIVNVSSVMADFASPLGGAYSVAKAGVAMLSRLLAVEWGPKGVRSNCVQPALVITPLSQPIYDQPEFMQKRSAAPFATNWGARGYRAGRAFLGEPPCVLCEWDRSDGGRGICRQPDEPYPPAYAKGVTGRDCPEPRRCRALSRFRMIRGWIRTRCF